MNIKRTVRNWALACGITGLCWAGAMAQGSTSGAQTQNSGRSSNTTESQMGTSATSKGHSVSDREFVRKAAQGGMAEVQLGTMATEKAASADVKQFGQRMVNDHSKANDELKEIAQKQGINLPDKLNAKDEALKDKLQNLSGQAFDRAYMKNMVKDHKKDIAEFKHEANTGKDSAVKNFAEQTVPTLESHLKEAQSIAPKVGVSSTASTTGGGSQ